MAEALARLGDAKLVKIVAMVDALPARGEADALIAPLRPRLADLHVPRPLRFGRVLSIPLDAVLVHARDWRRGSPSVPRVALQPLATLVGAELQGEVTEINARLTARPGDHGLLLTEGHAVWPRAASILRAAAAPESWAAAGLAVGDFALIVEAVCLVLEHAALVHEAPPGSTVVPPEADATARRLEEVLLSGSRSASSSVSCLLAAMLATRSGASARIDAIETKLTPSLRPALRRCRAAALAFLMDKLEAGGSLAGSLWKAVRQVRRDAGMLEDMTQEARHDPAHRARMEAMRRTMDERCRTRFDAAIQSELVSQGPSAAPIAAPIAALGDEAMGALEEKARTLRMFAQAAARIGSHQYYDRCLGEAAECIARAAGAGLSRMDRVRLVEMLQGSSAAWGLLRRSA